MTMADHSIAVPSELRTTRLYLRRWRSADATLLAPTLQVSETHLRWIPPHVAAPAPVTELEQRLSGYARDFEAGRAWRYAILAPEHDELYGEVCLFPRSAEGRVHISKADRLEIGYWLRQDVTGRGYATEAARAMVDIATGMQGMCQVEIRCDAANAPSAAIPRRLGFQLANSVSSSDLLWIHPVEQ